MNDLRISFDDERRKSIPQRGGTIGKVTVMGGRRMRTE